LASGYDLLFLGVLTSAALYIDTRHAGTSRVHSDRQLRRCRRCRSLPRD
jgi:hypothetical protein